MPEIDDARGRPSEGSSDDLVAALAEAHVGPADLDAALQARGITGLPTHTRTDLADTLAVVQALRAEPALADPSPAVWDRISADLAHEADVDATAPGRAADASVVDLGARRARRDGRRLRWAPAAAAAVVGLLVGGGVTWLGLRPQPEPPVAAPRVLGDATLGPVTATGTEAHAEMLREADGALELRVDVPEVPDAEAGYYEVWLRDADATRLISLGTVTSTSTTLTVPEGIDFARYPVVDVSHEHFDGDPTHSGATLWAGPMTERS